MRELGCNEEERPQVLMAESLKQRLERKRGDLLGRLEKVDAALKVLRMETNAQDIYDIVKAAQSA